MSRVGWTHSGTHSNLHVPFVSMNHFGPKIDENNIDCIDLSHCQGVATSDTCHTYTWCKHEIHFTILALYAQWSCLPILWSQLLHTLTNANQSLAWHWSAMDAHVLMYYSPHPWTHAGLRQFLSIVIKHCIPSLPFSVYYINISFCHAPSFPDPQPLVQEIGRVCNKRLREAWEWCYHQTHIHIFCQHLLSVGSPLNSIYLLSQIF